MNDARTREAIDALAQLLCTGPEDIVPTDGVGPELKLSGSDRPAPVVDAILVGHLPGYASPWVSQYVSHLAQQYEGAALLRISEDEIEYEMFDAEPPPESGPAESMSSNAASSRAMEVATTDELVEMLHDSASSVGAFVILFDEPSKSPQKTRLMGLRSWTILTGADDAAIVAAYRMIKSLLSDAERGKNEVLPHLRVMFMGCDDPTARAAAFRLNRAVGELLDAPVEIAGVRKRMAPVRRRRVGRFAIADESRLWLDLGEMFAEASLPEPVALPDEVALATEPIAPKAKPAGMHASLEDADATTAPVFSLEPKIQTPIEPRRPAAAAPVVESPKAEAPLVEPRVTEETPEPRIDRSDDSALRSGFAKQGAPDSKDASRTSAPAPTPAPAFDADDLTIYVPSTVNIAARCPRHPQVQIALGDDGRLHMMMRTQKMPTDEAIRTLLATRAWLAEHQQLVALTCHDRKVDAASPAVAHFFTDEPRTAAEFVYAAPPQQRPFKLHLLKAVEVAAGHVVELHEALS
ncbi:MAG: hypothetical protein GC162_10620 [Planctomycetes bacterium]|nr:hypothetical protein [Planctomycetota bacterium]